ncbi:hypothetical protein SJAV_05030 [Sulfurisphaera javensis]|uniref:Uncharacterized protein n=1 Tax=Sulfurisphaera javensis TaxID=2049879 RepID=A0AAT9GP20_9CREN
MNRLMFILVIIDIIFTLTLSNLFVFNLTFPAIKIILSINKREKLKQKRA